MRVVGAGVAGASDLADLFAGLDLLARPDSNAQQVGHVELVAVAEPDRDRQAAHAAVRLVRHHIGHDPIERGTDRCTLGEPISMP